METKGQRIKRLREEKGLSQQAVADAVGVSRVAVTKWESGETKNMQQENFLRLAELFSVTPEHIERGTEIGRAPPQAMDLSEHPDLVSIRRVQFKLAAGVHGYAIEPLTGEGMPIFFRKDWLQTRGYRADKLVAIKVCGASMEPGLYDGDLVVVNTADTKPADGEVFAVNYEGEMGVKRLQRDAGEWWLTSDNGDQRRFQRKRCNGDVQLIGRVIYKQSERL